MKHQLRGKERTLKQVRAKLTVATSEMRTLRLIEKKAVEELSIIQTDVSLQMALQEEARKQLTVKVVVLEELRSRLEMREEGLATMNDAQTKVAVELEQLRTQTANRTFESVEVHSAAKDDERPTERAKVSRRSEQIMGAPSFAAYFALFAKHDEFKSRCEALMLENRCIPGLGNDAKELRAKVADIKISNASTKGNATSGRSKKRLTVAEKRVVVLETEL